ncbi:uncharacterized protein LOC122075448 isoform X2 [Macadamia integrifolia]|uniref:uncharacterized protein LOC122075448 isoform X2 n=1 Tax=Macadamia integrifolia TaxID=60698 RepID=UPI001C4EF753|nr:uncharacterized protein LOC122075448 isoform X2 [Macadamia integrifolia]
MGLLFSCWFLIEYVLSPVGDEKWIRLSFFIHRHIFILCQAFSWIGVFGGKMLAVLFFPFRIVWFLSSQVSKFLTYLRILLLSINYRAAEVVIRCEIPENSNPIQTIILRNCYPGVLPTSRKMKSVEVERNWFELKESIKEELIVHVDGDMSENESSISLQSYASQITGVDAENERDGSDVNIDEDVDMDESFSDINSPEPILAEAAQNERELGVNMYEEDMDMNKFSSSVLISESNDMEAETENEKENNQSDPFYAKYIERMKWFDLLNYERTCGISSILNKQLGTPSSFESIEPIDFSAPFLSWSKMDRRKLLRSLENDFEMVYVGQSCLCWEALHHQYRKVEALACTGLQKGVFYENVAGEFQNFQVLLERFMEYESIQGKRFWNYVQGRFSLKSLLQVPEVSGCSEGEEESREGEAMGASDVLETIEKSIMTFSNFIAQTIRNHGGNLEVICGVINQWKIQKTWSFYLNSQSYFKKNYT